MPYLLEALPYRSSIRIIPSRRADKSVEYIVIKWQMVSHQQPPPHFRLLGESEATILAMTIP
jgi:hypothetical protein